MACRKNDMIIIAAVALNGVIGKDGKMPWHIPSDLRRFKQFTMGKTLVMGRHTYESLPPAKLPGRDLIVLSRGGGMDKPNLRYAHLLTEALAMPRQANPLIVAGGAQVYAEALACTYRMFITRVYAQPDGDTFFPDLREDWDLENTPSRTRFGGDEYDTAYEVWKRHV